MLYQGDCLDVMRTLVGNTVDAVVTDPPYGISFMGKAWDGKDIERVMATKTRKGTVRPDGWQRHDGAAFAAGTYDLTPKGMLAFQLWTQEWAHEALRVLKPGGHLLSFASPRTYHRMVVGIEDAGFEIRDQIMWVFGSGFPKSLNVGKAIDATLGAERETVKRIDMFGESEIRSGNGIAGGTGEFTAGNARSAGFKAEFSLTTPATVQAEQWQGWGTALKPAHEPIVMARKPLEGTVAENVLKHGCGGVNVDGCRVDPAGDSLKGGTRPGSAHAGYDRPFMHDAEDLARWKEQKESNQAKSEALGRWPANLIHDGSEEVLGAFPDAPGMLAPVRPDSGNGNKTNGILGTFATNSRHDPRGDTGSAARFFYCAKASKADRDEGCGGLAEVAAADRVDREEGSAGMNNPRAGAARTSAGKNHHPTVKPTDLMRYLVRLVTPPGGVVLDPFMGSGSTGKACVLEGFGFIGIERDEGYMPVARARIAYAERLRAEETAQGNLFGEVA